MKENPHPVRSQKYSISTNLEDKRTRVVLVHIDKSLRFWDQIRTFTLREEKTGGEETKTLVQKDQSNDP